MSISRIIKMCLLTVGSMIFRNKKSKILFYHDFHVGEGYVAPDCGVVMGTQLDAFKKHLEVIKKEGYTIVPKITKEEGEIAIMLDDGFRGVYENRQFFYDNNICPTIFLAVDLIEKDGFLTKDEILELQDHGFIFECHSWSHTNLANKSDKELKRELGESKEYLSKLLGKEVTEICLPIGYFSDHLLEQLRAYGYKEIYSSIPGNYSDRIHGYIRARILCQFASPKELKMFLRGGSKLIRGRYEKRHHVNEL